MPFSPLPATFREDLRRLAPAGVLELGCGDGAFTKILRDFGVEPVTLDRRRSPVAGKLGVVADALAAPFTRGRLGMVVAANLLRQVWPQVAANGPSVWRELLVPGGRLYFFEDEPLAEPVPARNYRDLQAFLARVDPDGRRPLLARRDFERASRRWRWPGMWRTGARINRCSVDAERVLTWLGGSRREPGGEADRLYTSIAERGLSYGEFWWAAWSGKGA